MNIYPAPGPCTNLNSTCVYRYDIKEHQLIPTMLVTSGSTSRMSLLWEV